MTVYTDYKIEFERLLEYSKQALGCLENKSISQNSGLKTLEDVVLNYQKRIDEGVLDTTCSYSYDGRHTSRKIIKECFCIYCGAKEIIES